MSLRAAFAEQAETCAALGSPFTARLLTVIAERLAPGGAVADRLLSWPGDASYRGDSVALRLAGGLHALALRGDPALAALYRAPEAVADAALRATVSEALGRHETFLMRWLDSPPQTNEVRRSAVLIGAARWLTARHGLPLLLSELGASGGLNLLWDRYRLEAGGQSFGPPDPVLVLGPDWTGPLPAAAEPVVAGRAGVDLNPLDPEHDRLRLLAYIWADQADRLARTEAARREALRHPGLVRRGDAADWLERRLATPRPGALHLVFHTIAWQYFPPETRDRCTALLDAAGARATASAPLARFGMEIPPGGRTTLLTLRLWPGGRVIPMGEADPHGRWVRWAAPALD